MGDSQAKPTAEAATPPMASDGSLTRVEELVKSLAEARKEIEELKSSRPSDGEEAAPKNSKKDGGKYIPKTPLGMRDMLPEEMAHRERVFDTIRNVFKCHGAVTIDTPVAELKETLVGKYGEDSKLIYDLADQGGEKLALRYDLTVPFARFCAEHGVDTIKRYHIARVYRRDNPVIAKGRYREFYQCDFDIAGEYEAMAPDAECVKIVTEILGSLDVGDFIVKVNHRQLLDGIFAVCGVPEELLRPICSAVDKLDKLPWAEVKVEMVAKGITEEQADQIGTYVSRSGDRALAQELLQDPLLAANESARVGLEQMVKLYDYCIAMAVPLERISFDLSMARGLDYYTGVIYEAVLVGAEVGSVAGGGRYDGLVGRFLAAKKKRNKKGGAGAERKIPCVGVSLGIERLITVASKRRAAAKLAPVGARPTQVLVAGVQGAEDRQRVFTSRLEICGELWAAGIRAETMHKLNPKFMSQIQHCEKEGVPLCVVVGPGELDAGTVKINVVPSAAEVQAGAERAEETVPRAEMIGKLKELLLAHQAK